MQFYGVAATIGFTFTASFIVFMAIKYTVGLRVSEEDELRGLDISEHACSATRSGSSTSPAPSRRTSRAAPSPAPAGAATATNPATAS